MLSDSYCIFVTCFSRCSLPDHLQVNNAEWKTDLKDLYITAAKEVEVSGWVVWNPLSMDMSS